MHTLQCVGLCYLAIADPGEAKQAVAEEEEEKEQAQATAIHTAIANRLLPRLHRVLAQKVGVTELVPFCSSRPPE